MGDWTQISIGDKNVMYFKNRIPLFAVLIFDESDYQYEIERGEPIYDDTGENVVSYDEEKLYKFSSSVRKAKQLLDNRGIDEEFCRQTFNDLRSDVVWIGSEDGDVPNIVDYDIYQLMLTDRIFSSNNTSEDQYDELERYREYEQALFDSDYPSHFWGEEGHAFDEILSIIYLRTILQIAPQDEHLTLDIYPITNYMDMYETLYRYVSSILKQLPKKD